jgi:hypothetical protein
MDDGCEALIGFVCPHRAGAAYAAGRRTLQVAAEDWGALSILVELRKFILVASQFFEFLHRLCGVQLARPFCANLRNE